MKIKVDLEELKKIQIEILDYVVSFCEKHSIKYWLDCGTLLGAIRHKGYIPWDDDIDIGMLREDYDKFIKTFNMNNSSNYVCYSVENNNDFFFPFAKVMDKKTELFEPDENGFKYNIFIDVFVYDNAPDDEKKVKKMFKKRDFYTYLNGIRGFKNYYSSKKIVSVAKRIMEIGLFLFPRNYFAKRIINNSKKYVAYSTKRVGDFTSVSKNCVEKSIFSEMIDVEFEGKMYKAPNGYDVWLKSFYGDYMKLPPIEKRISNHKFVAYKISKED